MGKWRAKSDCVLQQLNTGEINFPWNHKIYDYKTGRTVTKTYCFSEYDEFVDKKKKKLLTYFGHNINKYNYFLYIVILTIVFIIHDLFYSNIYLLFVCKKIQCENTNMSIKILWFLILSGWGKQCPNITCIVEKNLNTNIIFYTIFLCCAGQYGKYRIGFLFDFFIFYLYTRENTRFRYFPNVYYSAERESK